MKNYLPFLSFMFLFLPARMTQAQSFLTQSGTKDTAAEFYHGNDEMTVYNMLHSASATPVVVKWHITNSSFGPSWRFGGFCDNNTCVADSVMVMTGYIYESQPYPQNPQGDMHVIFDGLNAAPWNTFSFVKATVQDTAASGTTRNLTFIGYKNAAGVTSGFTSNDDVVVFPNPARESVNVIFNEAAGVKTIAIFNLIGKMVNVYKPTSNGSAKLDIDNIPAGVYFLRLLDAKGQIVATRRFNRQ